MVDTGKPEHQHPAIPHYRPPLSGRQIIAQIGVAAVILISGIAIGGGGTILALKNRIIPVIDTPVTSGTRSRPDANELAKRSDWIAERWKAESRRGGKERSPGSIAETVIKAGPWSPVHKAHSTLGRSTSCDVPIQKLREGVRRQTP